MPKRIIYKTNKPNNFEIQFQLSKVCNMQCRYCTAFDSKIHVSKGNETEIEIYNKLLLFEIFIDLIIKNNQDSSLNFINLYGGEPLLFPKLNKILEIFSKTKNLFLFITTNGTLISELENLLKKAEELKIKDRLFFSISLHETTNFKKMLNFAEILNQFNTAFLISIILLNTKKASEKKIEKLFEKIKIIKNKNYLYEFKYELDPFTLEINETDVNFYESKIKITNKYKNNKYDIAPFVHKNIEKITIEDGVKKKESIAIQDVFYKIKIIPRKTVCYNKEFGMNIDLKSNQFLIGFSCNEGPSITFPLNQKINKREAFEKINKFMQIKKITCNRTSCTQSRHSINTILVNY